MTIPSDSKGQLIFCCTSCGLKLSVELHLAGVSGPCPVCGTVICAPGLAAAEVLPSSATDTARASKGTPRRRRGRIPPDTAVDQGDLDRRDATQTVKILVLFILVFCACLAVTWFMKDWVSR